MKGQDDPAAGAVRIRQRVRACPDRSVGGLRAVRRAISDEMAPSPASLVLSLADALLESGEDVPKWFVYELVHFHRPTLQQLDGPTLLRLGRGISSWTEVDPFACYLTGVAWRQGTISDAEVYGWTSSEDRWWRRAALVSTVALNSRARGGSGDPVRTLAVCDRLKDDRDDMVVKAMSWALRELAKRDHEAVAGYLAQTEGDLAPPVVREVRSKLTTGLKNPGRSSAPEARGEGTSDTPAKEV